jgi:hypothetical protein
MPEIGPTLRETRMRQRLDIVEVEAATKIRAKYLRALENEEWDQLPGPTFVRTFLRTYGDYLGLDSKMLVEEYKQRFQRPTPQELLPFSPRAAGRRQRRSFAIPPFVLIGLCIVVLLGALYAIGTVWDDDGGESAATPTATATPAADEPKRKQGRRRKPAAPAAPKRVALRIRPTGLVNVCLVAGAGGGRVLIPSENLDAGADTEVFRAKRLRVTFGNGNATMRVGGKTYPVREDDEPVGYDLRPGKKPKELAAGQRPTCL